MKSSLKWLWLGFSVVGCASSPKDFKEPQANLEQAQLVIYRPHRVPNLWADYEVSVNGKALKIVKDEGFVTTIIPTGPLKISSRHTQVTKDVQLELKAEKGQTLFVKIDPDINHSIFTVAGEILKVSTLVSSVGAQARIESGQGNLNDAMTMIRAEKLKRSMGNPDSDPRKELGYHTLLHIAPQAALQEVKDCCSSERTAAPTALNTPSTAN